ncbi:hypothetical protein PMG11_11305 [Penicillium brasilianum]|uniref:Uncharacterized protein n=1 Tax=Penicillium brasilianum TaxID=104259 RepID=A0A0F7U1G0_PENBI|nr:hypothetical protein PMG11_11305 [Penicillium brasilianum]
MHFSRFLCVVFTTAVAAQSTIATVYSDPQFSGPSQQISSTEQCVPLDLNTMPPKVRSIQVAPGVQCTTYTDSDCEEPNQYLPSTQSNIILGQPHSEAVSCLQFGEV